MDKSQWIDIELKCANPKCRVPISAADYHLHDEYCPRCGTKRRAEARGRKGVAAVGTVPFVQAHPLRVDPRRRVHVDQRWAARRADATISLIVLLSV